MTTTAVDVLNGALARIRDTLGRIVPVDLSEPGRPRAGSPAGRLTVAPGQTIASTWGNTAYDHTTMCFLSAADRDNQFPAPHEGAMVYLQDVKRRYVYTGAGWAPTEPRSSRYKMQRSANGIASGGLCDVGLAPNTEYYNGSYVSGVSSALTFVKPCLLNIIANWAGGAATPTGRIVFGTNLTVGASPGDMLMIGGTAGGGYYQIGGSFNALVAAGDVVSMQVRGGTGAWNLNANTYITCTDVTPVTVTAP